MFRASTDHSKLTYRVQRNLLRRIRQSMEASPCLSDAEPPTLAHIQGLHLNTRELAQDEVPHHMRTFPKAFDKFVHQVGVVINHGALLAFEAQFLPPQVGTFILGSVYFAFTPKPTSVTSPYMRCDDLMRVIMFVWSGLTMEQRDKIYMAVTHPVLEHAAVLSRRVVLDDTIVAEFIDLMIEQKRSGVHTRLPNVWNYRCLFGPTPEYPLRRELFPDNQENAAPVVLAHATPHGSAETSTASDEASKIEKFLVIDDTIRMSIKVVCDPEEKTAMARIIELAQDDIRMTRTSCPDQPEEFKRLRNARKQLGEINKRVAASLGFERLFPGSYMSLSDKSFCEVCVMEE